MLTPGIDPVVIAPNTPACARRLRPWRIGRRNYAQWFEAGGENGRFGRITRARSTFSAILTVGFRTDGAGTPFWLVSAFMRSHGSRCMASPCGTRYHAHILTQRSDVTE